MLTPAATPLAKTRPNGTAFLPVPGVTLENPYIVTGTTAIIWSHSPTLLKASEIDAADLPLAKSISGSWAAVCTANGSRFVHLGDNSLHLDRLITGAVHLNGNTLDNKRANLRVRPNRAAEAGAGRGENAARQKGRLTPVER